MMSSSLGAMGSLLRKLHSLLVSPEDELPEPLKPQKDKLELLKQDLEVINTYLLNLSGVEDPKTLAKLWMQEVRDLSYDIEDYIDKTMHPYSHTDKCKSWSEEEELSALVEQANDTRNRHDRYDLEPQASDHRVLVVGQGPVPALSEEDMDLVGIGDLRTELIRRLNNDAGQQLKVVPVFGPVGVGKTTLATEVYHQISGQFECRIFVRASRMPDTRRLLQSMISQVQRHERPPCGLLLQELIDNLSERLKHKRYFIVIDGLWKTRTWHIVKSAFPEGNHCSRILITTDIEEVALECSDYGFGMIFQMKPLSELFSTELFFNRLCGFKNKPSEKLKESCREIIAACAGLPLATIIIAILLASQANNSELLHYVKEYLSSRLRNNLTSENMLKEIVGLSYNSLPHHLKTCLLYLSMYPEGYTFLKADLVKQWSAEDFISAVDGKDTNEVGGCYFDELVCRGLIQPICINFPDTMVSYTLHSIMYEVIRYKSIEENFTTVLDYSNTIPELSAVVRRLSLGYSNAKYAAKPDGVTLSSVRSIIFYGLVRCLPSVTKFEVLRVLKLEFWGAQEELDLSSISQLFQLRYVRVTTDIVVKLPAEMKGLQYLETLEIYAKVTFVPPDIVHLQRLLHLCLQGSINLSDGISHMRSLRTLQSFDLSSTSEDNVRQLGEMTDLQDLHVTSSTEMSDHLKRKLIALISSLENHYKLKSLLITPGPSCPSICLDCTRRVSSLPVYLQRLELLPPICIFSRLPEWIGQLRKLCILKIVVRELTNADVNRIAMLQELTVLSLYVRQPTAARIIFNCKAFPVLKYFKFRCGILRFTFQEQAMPNLRWFNLKFNAHKGEPYGDMVAGIEHLLNLQEITVRIGAAPGVEESDMTAAESAFRDTICSPSRPLCFSIGRVDSIMEETPEFSGPATSSPRSAQVPEAVFLALTKIGRVLEDERAKVMLVKLSEKVHNLKDLEDKIKKIESQLTTVGNVIQKIGTVYLTDEVVRCWIGEVRKLAHHVEDVMDKYSYHTLQMEEEWFLKKYFIKGSHYVLVFSHIADEVLKIEKEIKNVIELKEQWLQPSQLDSDPLMEIERQRSQDSFPLLVKDENLVGIEYNRRKLTEWLYSDELDSTVMTILGMGGLGKTTLVTNVYEREKINFSAPAWMVVSQTYTMDALLRKLLMQVGGAPNIDKMDAHDLKENIKQKLKNMKCLIVLDDVWDQDVYLQMRDAFQNLQASRIIITTRNNHVAYLAHPTRRLDLQPLSKPHAFDLFCRRTFYNKKDHSCPNELVEVATSIVHRCQGLPLAIVSIAGLLSSRPQAYYIWNQMYNQLRSELSNNDNVRAILNLSYHDLSGDLRNCFLYCSLFPEDYPISRESLVRLWVAEGFVVSKENNISEEVAEGNLMELIHRNMLAVVETDEQGRVSTCAMHDIVRDLALTVAKEEKFGTANNYRAMMLMDQDKDVRRLSSYGWKDNTSLKVKLPHLRTLVSLGTISSSPDMLLSILSESSYLTVLELQDSEITEVPASIGALFNLRYIGLRRTKVRSLPDSVEKLLNLQTLDIRQTKIEKLPRGISKIKKLRHLLADRHADEKQSAFRYFIGIQAPKDLSNLAELQTLETVEANKDLAEQLKKLTQLRTLWIDNISTADCANIFAALSKMSLLSSLLLSAKDENEALCFEALKPCSTELHRLIIRGQWAKGTLQCPIFRGHGRHLRYLVLSWCQLGEDPLEMLAPHLPNLTNLRLNNIHSAKTLVLPEGSFPHLKMLVLRQMPNVNHLVIGKGALPCIEGLYIVSLAELDKVPQGIESLGSLRKLWLVNLHRGFLTQWNMSGMHHKMQHVLEIRV